MHVYSFKYYLIQKVVPHFLQKPFAQPLLYPVATKMATRPLE
uniref:Uncharacterized protein n=1 Tax=Amphimedon queenslandica TaxID=400682 RepID=A0A1X7SVH8_AMPQE